MRIVSYIIIPAKYSFPDNYYVNDFTNYDAEQSAASKKQHRSAVRTGAQIVVVIVETIGDMSIEEYSNALFREWGIGQADKITVFCLLLH